MVEYIGDSIGKSCLAGKRPEDSDFRRKTKRKSCFSICVERKKVEFLSKEAIARVLAAEAEANAIRERAVSEAAARVEACERACAEEEARQILETKDQLARRRALVSERADALIIQSREEAEADIEEMRAAAREKMREAVKHIEWELTDI